MCWKTTSGFLLVFLICWKTETSANRYPSKTIGNNIVVENPALGINLYRNVFSKEDSERYIKILESNLGQNGKYKWSEAKVTNSDVPIKKARDAVDFRFKQENLGPRDEHNSELIDLHEEIYQKLKFCVDDYARYWGINVVYYEAFNFVKYEGEGTHFNIHADHGPMYNCTVSAVIYINDDYEGGELYFPLQGVQFKPKKGAAYFFPGDKNYIHGVTEVKSGLRFTCPFFWEITKHTGDKQP